MINQARTWEAIDKAVTIQTELVIFWKVQHGYGQPFNTIRKSNDTEECLDLIALQSSPAWLKSMASNTSGWVYASGTQRGKLSKSIGLSRWRKRQAVHHYCTMNYACILKCWLMSRSSWAIRKINEPNSYSMCQILFFTTDYIKMEKIKDAISLQKMWKKQSDVLHYILKKLLVALTLVNSK